MLLLETGLPGDEGTMAEIMCRRKWQVFFTKRGGMSCFIPGSNKQATGYSVVDHYRE